MGIPGKENNICKEVEANIFKRVMMSKSMPFKKGTEGEDK
jgi:hypothetical protein